MGFNQERFKEGSKEMQALVEDVQRETKSIFSDFGDLIEKHPWETLQKLGKGLESTYNENVLAKIKKDIEEWGDGESSFVAMVKIFNEGEDNSSITNAQKQQQEVIDVITGIGELDEISSKAKIIENMKIETDLIKSELEEISTKSEKLKDIVDEHITKLKTLEVGNEAISPLIKVATVYGESVSNFVGDTTKNIQLFLEGKFDEIRVKLDSYKESASEWAKKVVEDISANINKISDAMDEFF